MSVSITFLLRSYIIFLLLYAFLRLGIHDRIGLGVLRVLIHKRDYHVVKQNQSASRLRVCHMGKLLFGKPQLVCKYRLILAF